MQSFPFLFGEAFFVLHAILNSVWCDLSIVLKCRAFGTFQTSLRLNDNEPSLELQ